MDKPPRVRFSNEACQRLSKIYDSGIIKPNKQLREELAKELDKTPRSIQIWFQNKRAKHKKHHNSSDSDNETYKRKPGPLDMNAVRRQPKSDQLSACSIPQTAASVSTSPMWEDISSTPFSFAGDYLKSPFPTLYEENTCAPVTPISPKPRAVRKSPPSMVPSKLFNNSQHIMSPKISNAVFFRQQQDSNSFTIEPSKDLGQLTTAMMSNRPVMMINTSGLVDYATNPNDFLSPTSLLSPFQNACLQSPMDLGHREAFEVMKDPQSFLKWANEPLPL